jgi:Zn-dependent M28 family amino/carboxypeptidase
MRILYLFPLFACLRLSAQTQDTIFSATAVEAVEQSLASDAMRGRAVFTPDIERAADYIESQFRASGLKTWNGSASYRQPFTLVRAKLLSISGSVDNLKLTTDNTIIISAAEHIRISTGDVKKEWIHAGEDLRSSAQKLIAGKGNHLIVVDTSFANTFTRLSRLAGQQFGSPYTNVFVLSNDEIVDFSFTLTAEQEVHSSALANVVGILPGKGKHKNEYVIFSGHYDHLGVRKPDARGDSIYNGANDDASGTTAVILLSRYFSNLHNNDRGRKGYAFTGRYGSGPLNVRYRITMNFHPHA